MKVKANHLKIVMCVLIAAVVLAVGVICVSTIIKKNKKTEEYDIEPQQNIQTIYGDDELGISEEVDKQLKDYQNIALLGIDTAEIEDKKGNRSDAIIIVSIHKETRNVKIFSIYRDTYLDVEVSNGLDKINHAYAFGGIKGTLKALNQNLELNIKDAVVLPWNAVSTVVDQVGGVDVEILASEMSYMNKSLPAENQIQGTGMQTLNGEQAVLYSRIRKDSPEGDYRRNERMKIILLAAFDKVKDYDMEEMIVVMSSVIDETESNMSNTEIVELFYDMSYQIQNSFEWPYTKKGFMHNSVYYLAPVSLESNVERLHQEMFGQTDYQAGEYVMQVSGDIQSVSGY